MLYFFIILNLLIIGNSFASPLHTLTIPIKANITMKTYSAVLNNVLRNENGPNNRALMIDTIKLNTIKIINKFIPWIA